MQTGLYLLDHLSLYFPQLIEVYQRLGMGCFQPDSIEGVYQPVSEFFSN